MGGHATHDEREARATFDSTLFSHWGKRDPIGLYEACLIQGALDLESGQHTESSGATRENNSALLGRIEARLIEEVERAADDALQSARSNMPFGASAAEGVYVEEVTNEAVAAS